jgi:hypothetical protein
MRRTLFSVRNSRIPAVLGLCPDDPKFRHILNEAQERLITTGSWWGTFGRYRCLANNGILVWPRQIAGIFAAAVSSVPIKTRDIFFEFSELGYGIEGPMTCGLVLKDAGNLPVFQPISGNTSQVKVYCDLVADVNTPVLLLGHDANGNWIRTVQNGAYADGEVVLASTTGTLSVNIFEDVTGVQLQQRNGPVRLYSYDTVTAVQIAIGVYDYDETNPWYRVSRIEGLNSPAVASNPVTIDVACKFEFIPAIKDTDYLLIGCLPALKDMCSAIVAAEDEPTQAAKAQSIQAGMAMAQAALEQELRHYNGAPESSVNVQGSSGPTGEPIVNLV